MTDLLTGAAATLSSIRAGAVPDYTDTYNLVVKVVEQAPWLLRIPEWILWPLLMVVVGCGVPIGFVTVFSLMAVWAERKISAFMQSRLGPMEVGPWGLFQTLADGVKLMAKEDIIPRDADRALYVCGPVLVFAGVFLSFVVLPFGPDLIVADLDTGLFYLAAVGAVEVLGVLMAGWASNNKWALFGTMRMVTQLVSYEVPLGLCFLTVAVVAGSLQINGTLETPGIILGQHPENALLGFLGLHHWLVFRNPLMPVAFLVYFIAALAETKRAPFDLPEAESELVAGFHTEYSAMRFSMFFLAEYAAMYVVCAIASIAFLGGWLTGIQPIDQWMITCEGWQRIPANLIGGGAIVTKACFGVCVQMWLRWTLPRIRLDQVMALCLKYLLPFSLASFLVAGVFEVAYESARFAWIGDYVAGGLRGAVERFMLLAAAAVLGLLALKFLQMKKFAGWDLEAEGWLARKRAASAAAR